MGDNPKPANPGADQEMITGPAVGAEEERYFPPDDAPTEPTRDRPSEKGAE